MSKQTHLDVPLEPSGSSGPLLDICGLRVSFNTNRGNVTVVDGFSLTIGTRETVALVGESGCGKSVTALSILRLLPQPPARIDGSIVFRDPQNECFAVTQGIPVPSANSRGLKPADQMQSERAHGTDNCVDLLQLPAKGLHRIRGGRIAMIFQEPMSALNPVLSVGDQIAESVELHQSLRGKATREVVAELLHQVGIAAPRRRMNDFPHQLSGGMLQRVMIAMALAGRPALLIADEPTTALDVTVQAQVLELLASLQETYGMSMLLITHDLAVVGGFADRIYVMYAGKIVEQASVAELFARPLHPYSRGLLDCMPALSMTTNRFRAIPGQVPQPGRFPPGCRFHPRCRLTADRAQAPQREMMKTASEFGDSVLRRCVQGTDPNANDLSPPLNEITPGHSVACWEIE